MSRFSITTPIFYVNARPHIGHAYTVVAADVIARAHRLRGDEVFFLTGTDEHGAKIAEAAASAGKSPQAYADDIVQTFREAWLALDVRPDEFIRTTEPRHETGVKKALEELHAKDLLYRKSYRGLYCTGCETFITAKDLDGEGKCFLHNRPPVEVEEENWFFRLSAFLPRVRTAIESGELLVLPEERRQEVFGLLKQGLDDFSVSRVRERVPWGIPLPFDDTQTVYVWVDALLNYLTALGYSSGSLSPFWPADVQLIGQDILKFHAVYWPALLLALDLPLPRALFVHGFFTVGGKKVSKSLGNAVDPVTLARRYGADATRFLLLSQFPLGASGDVQLTRLDEQYDAILANTIGNLVSRTVVLLQKLSGGTIPDARSEFLVRVREVLDLGNEKIIQFPKVALNNLDALVQSPVRLASWLNEYADHTAPWKETRADARAVALRTLADGVAALGLLAEPLLPSAGRSIQQAFHLRERALPSPGMLVTPPSGVLFPRAKDLPGPV